MASFAITIVGAWERGQGSPDWQRPAVLLSALSGAPLEETLQFGVARRDAGLLAWRVALFGGKWQAFAQCPACEAMLEYELPVPGDALEAPGDEIEIQAAGRSWRVRWPNTRDLAEAGACPNLESARSILLDRMLPDGARADNVETILARLAATHRSCWSMELHCCACPRTWNVVFSPGEFLWREIRAAARRIFRDVDSIARVYHWSEAEILSMTEARRHEYLEMVQ